MTNYVRAPQRRAQLLEAARNVLVRDGYQALTVRAVAREAGVRLSTVQRIFPTRTDLLNALVHKVMDDSGYNSYAIGNRGLRIELHDLAHWYGRQVLSDAGMRELLRAEFVANVGRRAPTAEDYPTGTPLHGDLLTGSLQQMHDESNEAWAVPASQLATLSRYGFVGLTYDLLRTGDTAAYRAGVTSFIDVVVALADPRPVAA